MTRIEFSVNGKPPKKDGANSMWNKDTEVPRLLQMRQAAYKAMAAQGVSAPLKDYISLHLDLYVPVSQLESIGDLDNFITGVCDGLQKADPKAKLHSGLDSHSNPSIHPRNPLIITNDSLVVEIVARKHPTNDTQPVYYRVAVEAVNIAYL